MTGAEARACLLALPGAWEDFPFGPDVAVMKVGRRMFATLATDTAPQSRAGADEAGVFLYRINLKCDPNEAVMLRDLFPAVLPGYHMNKRHWNTVLLDGSLPRGEIERMIENSHALVVAGMTRRERRELGLEPPS